MSDSSETHDGTSSEGEPVEYLATARAKRSTAGKHMSSLIDAEADDDLALLFAEDEEDEEFGEEEEEEEEEGEEGEEGEDGGTLDEADDMDLDSSSDEEDQGPDAKGDDELEGEKELERQAKAERLAKKRKVQDSMRLTALRKRVKIDPNLPGRSLTIPAPRLRKKSERISWLPTVEDGPTRSSTRKQTVRNKELTHARLKDSEQRRIRLIATMEQAAKRKETSKPKDMTQEERLAEAQKTERVNSKSLNRWEEMEKKRSEEQRLKLEALQNRRLDGSVMTWWSGLAQWINDKLARVGVKTYASAERGVNRKKKNREAQDEEQSNAVAPPAPEGESQRNAAAPTETAPQDATEAKPKDPSKEDSDNGFSFLDGIHDYAAMDEASSLQADQSAHSQTAASATEVEDGEPSRSTTNQEAAVTQPHRTPSPANTPSKASAAQTPSDNFTPSPNSVKASTLLAAFTGAGPSGRPRSSPAPESHLPTGKEAVETKPNIISPSPKATRKLETTSRNYLILEEFDSLSPEERNEYSILFNARKAQKLQKPIQDSCPVTGRVARYCDPQTGIMYADSEAYREIRQVVAGRYAWSGFLGCFVGELGGGARGVPERFLAPNQPPPKDVLGPTPPAEGEEVKDEPDEDGDDENGDGDQGKESKEKGVGSVGRESGSPPAAAEVDDGSEPVAGASVAVSS